MIVKKHISQDKKIILAICDSDLLGKKFEQDEKQLDLTSEFYQGKEMSEDDILKILPEVSSLNIVGRKSIEFALKHNLIDRENVKSIDNIPYAICVFVESES